jgi:multiple sugar transport system substrate-binding protein
MDPKKILLLGGLAVVTLVLIILLAAAVFLRGGQAVTLTYWGLWEPEAIYQTVIPDFQKTHPKVTIKYLKQSPQNYGSRLATALAGNSSPDIVRLHNTWVGNLKNYLSPAPASIFTNSSFKNTFYPVAASDLIVNSQILAVPLEYESLALYVNEDILRSSGREVPTIWDGDSGFLATARKLTVKDSNNRIITSGAAMGTASNTDHWQDILSLMMLQAESNLTKNPGSDQAAGALNYYAAFATGDRTWDETLENSTLAFANGKVAMYFGPSWRYFDLKAINPNLNFKIYPVPQLAGGTTVNFASYWAEAVSKKSPNQKIAWEFVQFLSSKDTLAKLYAAEANLRGFGEPYSRKDMASLLTADPNVGVFISGAPTAKSWHLSSFTSDGETGINSRIGKYYLDAVNSVIRGTDAKSALTTVASGVNQVLNK